MRHGHDGHGHGWMLRLSPEQLRLGARPARCALEAGEESNALAMVHHVTSSFSGLSYVISYVNLYQSLSYIITRFCSLKIPILKCLPMLGQTHDLYEMFFASGICTADSPSDVPTVNLK